MNRKAGNLPACYSVMLKHDANSTQFGAQKVLEKFSKEVLKYLSLSSRKDLQKSLVNTRGIAVVSSPICDSFSHQPAPFTLRRSSRYVKKLLSAFYPQKSIKSLMLVCIHKHVGLFFNKVTFTYLHC
jgi:hypothetical protein